MANKVLLAYVAADVVFVSMGVIMIVFSITVGNIDRLPPNDGTEAARDLLYQRFPLTGSSKPQPLEGWSRRGIG